VEAMIAGLDAAMRDERLLESLHVFNGWIQLTNELGQAFFGHPAQVGTPASQTQSQTMAAN
jgi:hypothetical protein